MGSIEHPLVSVIVPAFNAENCIDACLGSVTCQSYPNLQIVVVNDGSTDLTSSICARWKSLDSRIEVICQSNQGVSSARNTGLSASRGEWVMFVDSDDRIVPTAVRRLLSVCPAADVVSFGWQVIGGDGKVVEEKAPRAIGVGNEVDLLVQNVRGYVDDYVWSYFFRRSSLGEITSGSGPFAEGCGLFEDSLFLQKYLRGGNRVVVFVPWKLYQYRLASGSATQGRNPEAAWTGLCAVKELERLLVPDELKGLWHAKLMRMLVLGVDRMAGPGWGDDQLELHREVSGMVRRLARLGGWRALGGIEKMKFALFILGAYRPLRRARNQLISREAREVRDK